MDLPPSIAQTHGRTATSYCNRRLPEAKATGLSDGLRLDRLRPSTLSTKLIGYVFRIGCEL
jgi:hypothetical protein